MKTRSTTMREMSLNVIAVDGITAKVKVKAAACDVCAVSAVNVRGGVLLQRAAG